MEKVEGGICLMCREWIPAGKDEHTCFDAYEELQQRVRELEAELKRWQRAKGIVEDRLQEAETRWEKLREWLTSKEAWTVEGGTFYPVFAKMQQLEAPAEGGREEARHPLAEFADKMKPLEAVYGKLLNEHFWDLLMTEPKREKEQG